MARKVTHGPVRRAVRRMAGWLVGLLAVHAACAAEPAADVLGRMEKAMADVHTVKTRFVQEKKMALFNHPLVTSGSIWVEPPAHLLWRVESPMQYALALDGTRVRQWDGETGKTTSMSMDGNPVFSAVSEQLNAWFGGRYGLLAQDYDVEQKAIAPAAFVFVPKPAAPSAAMLKSVTVVFREDARYIASIQIDDAGGDVTTLKFEDTEINVPLDPKAWEL